MTNKISIRNIEESDITSIVDYFLNSNPDFLKGMGVNPEKMPDRKHWIKILTNELSVPIESKKFYFVIWMLNDKAIGHSNLTNIIYKEEAFMHLHMWNHKTRKKGIGTELARMSIKHYFEDIGIIKLFCEPYALNSAPNSVLEKVGFDFVQEYITVPGWICFEQPVKKWVFTSEKFRLLKLLQPTLQGEYVKLVPLNQTSFENLYQVASDPLIWEQHPNKNRYKREDFKIFFKGAFDSKSAFLIYNINTGALIGSTRYYDLNLNNNSIAIGYTFLSRSHWGKVYNREAKKLLLNYAFSLVENVIFHIGANNIRSQKAIEKIGAIKIGEQEMSYQGEDNKLNFVYQIQKKDWFKNNNQKLIEYKIRRANNRDIPEIKHLIFDILCEYGLAPDENGLDSSLSNIETNYFEQGGYFGVLVSSSNEIVGTVSIVNSGYGEFELRKMFLKKELRGKGFGKLLMNHILQYAKSNQCKKVTLDTIQVLHEAISLYKSYGFEPVKPKVINSRIDQTYELNLI